MVSRAGMEKIENTTKNTGAFASCLSRSFGRAKMMNAKMQKMVSWRVCAKKARMSARNVQCKTVFLSYAHLKTKSERAERNMYNGSTDIDRNWNSTVG